MFTIPNTILEKARFGKIFLQLTSMENDAALETLIKIQTDRGIDAGTAAANARYCIAAVAERETLFEQFSDDAEANLDQLFEFLRKKDPAERAAALHVIYFGLTAYDDPDFTAGEDLEQQVRDHLYRFGTPPTPEELENLIRRALMRCQIPPAAMKRLTRKLKHTEGSMATAMALAENSRNLKCLMTMDLWLEHMDTMTMEEAAVVACTDADYQAVADAVSKGFLTRDVARKVLVVLSVVALVAAVICLSGSAMDLISAVEAIGVPAPVIPPRPEGLSGRVLINYGNLFQPTSGDYLSFAIISAIEGMLALFVSETLLTKKASDLAGAAGSLFAGLFHSADKGAAAMEHLADAMTEETASATWEDPDIWTTARNARDSIAEEDDDPVYF